jgi:hypothetical protein
MDAGGRATHGAVVERARERRFKNQILIDKQYKGER